MEYKVLGLVIVVYIILWAINPPEDYTPTWTEECQHLELMEKEVNTNQEI